VEGVLMVAVRSRIRNEPWTLASSYKEALNVVRPLFVMNILVVFFPVLSMMNGIFHWRIWDYSAMVDRYTTPVIFVVFMMLPFGILSSSAPLSRALHNHLVFLGRNYVKYILFVLGGMVFLCAGFLLLNIAQRYNIILFQHPIQLTAVNICYGTISIVLKTTFFIAAYAFYLEYDKPVPVT
jgi:hypothetical protein